HPTAPRMQFVCAAVREDLRVFASGVLKCVRENRHQTKRATRIDLQRECTDRGSEPVTIPGEWKKGIGKELAVRVCEGRSVRGLRLHQISGKVWPQTHHSDGSPFIVLVGLCADTGSQFSAQLERSFRLSVGFCPPCSGIEGLPKHHMPPAR